MIRRHHVIPASLFFLISLTPGVYAAPAPQGAGQLPATEPSKDKIHRSGRFGAWGFDFSGMDRSARAGDDFNRYANGNWIRSTTIPDDRTRIGNFDALDDSSSDQVEKLLADIAAKPRSKRTPAEMKSNDLLHSFMDIANIERLGSAPLKAAFKRLGAAHSHNDMSALMGNMSSTSFGKSIFSIGISQDTKMPNRYSVYLSAGGMGLPDRDYYLLDSYTSTRKAYQEYIANLLHISNWPNPKSSAEKIIALETRIAQVSWTNIQRRDADKTYNPLSVSELERLAPQFDWRRYLRAAGLQNPSPLIVGEKSSFPKIARIFAATPLDILKSYEAFHIAEEMSPFLPARFDQARFKFRGTIMGGQPVQRSRAKRGIDLVNGILGEAVGRIYVARYFPPEAKREIDLLVENLRSSFQARLDRLDWMSPATRNKAKIKLDLMSVKIGYPDKWKDYNFAIDPDDLTGNILRSQAWEWQRSVGRLNGPVDRAEWSMTPQTANAYYDPSMNEIVFPAAILQAPFFDPKADPAINYGGIGAVIGHEMTHGFDDQGRKFDGAGRLSDWWTAEDKRMFDAKTKALVTQYSSVEILPGLKLNGDLTIGENIADLGGLSMALDAYMRSLNGKPAAIIDGLSGDQRVFLGWAQVWRAKMREDALRRYVVTNVHAPSEARINQVVRNMDAWYKAFDVTNDNRLYLEINKRVSIW